MIVHRDNLRLEMVRHKEICEKENREIIVREIVRLDRRKNHKRLILDPWIKNISGQDSNPYTSVLTNQK